MGTFSCRISFFVHPGWRNEGPRETRNRFSWGFLPRLSCADDGRFSRFASSSVQGVLQMLSIRRRPNLITFWIEGGVGDSNKFVDCYSKSSSPSYLEDNPTPSSIQTFRSKVNNSIRIGLTGLSRMTQHDPNLRFIDFSPLKNSKSQPRRTLLWVVRED